ncbi:hypothetical protein C0J52_25084, partial [Blattella germanica]
HGQQQYFRIQPRDVKVHEGGEALLECEVTNQAGQVQWTKDGFALEFGPEARDLRSYLQFLSSANLTGAPPSSIEIVDHAPNSKIEIRENQEYQLQCSVKNAKPAAKIVWYRGNVELKLDKRVDTTTEVGERHAKRVPYIEGYTEGETIRRGQTVELTCKSRGGNPPAQLIWYKNGEQIRMAYRTAGRVSENIYTFTADATDNKARYRCEASNIMSQAPLKAEIQLTVSISGPTEARIGDSVPLTCTTANSNPPAEIKWLVAGRHVRNATSRTMVSPEGGWITTSNITATVAPNKRSLVVICHGINMQLTENIVSTHTINVLYPPSQPMIHGYTEGTSIAVGTVQKISCISSGGNPLATLTWYKNDKKINSVTKVNDRSVSAEVTILVNVTDNEARYKCEASNSATEIPLFETATLNVHFPPDHVVIRKDPPELKTGTMATLTCDSSSSNPEARLSWWREGIPVTGVTNVTKPGLHGGKVSSIVLALDITPELNGIVYTCQATNEALQRSVHDAITLEVLYKPIFSDVPTEEQTGIEGQSLVLALQAMGNPSNIAYTWTKDGTDAAQDTRVIVDGPVLNITRLRKEDAGFYTCEAVNSEGASTVRFNLTVQYPASIKDAPEYVIVSPGEDAQLYCMADGNPLSESHMSWRREGFSDSDMEQRTVRTYRNGTSFLLVQQPTREDNGNFYCVVNNGIGNETTHKPEIDSSPQIAKAASNTGDTGRLVCRACGAPKLRFTWSREGATIPVNTTEKYYIDFHQVDLVTFESVLLVKHVRPSDYGGYECVVRNEMGFATTTVKLDVTSAPDPPTSLNILNVTHDSVIVGWVPGFDGGMEPSYRIRYRPTAAFGEGYRYVDVIGNNITSFAITGLNMATDYTISIMSFNKLGSSKYLPDTLRAKTSNELPPSYHSPSQDGDPEEGRGGVSSLVIVVVTVVGLAVLLLNVLLVGCCLHRRANKRLTGNTPKIVLGEGTTVIPDDLLGKGDIPRLVIIGVSITGAMLVLLNVGLVVCFIYRKRNKRLREGTSGAKLHYSTTTPPHPVVDAPYYNISPDARYIPYPPQLEFSHMGQPILPGTGSLRRPQHRGPVVPPPDVTVSHNPPPPQQQQQQQNGPTPPAPLLSTFNPALSYPTAMETEGHLV